MSHPLLLLCLSLTTTLFAQGEYFPLQTGNTWLYRSNRTAESWTLEITGEREVSGVNYHVLRGFPSGELLLRFTDAGTLVFRQVERGTPPISEEKPWVAFNAAVGEAWATAIDPCNNTAVIRSRSATVKSPTGEFENALEVGYQPANCADAGLTRELFLPGIGLVERRFTTIAGERILQLVRATIGGSSKSFQPEWSFTGALDKTAYASGEQLTARFTLRNNTGRPVELTFPSGQDYDLLLFDSKGTEIYRWSDGRAFTMIFRQISFTGEKSWLLVTPLPQLPDGDYMALLRLASEPRIETTLPLRIQRPIPVSRP